MDASNTIIYVSQKAQTVLGHGKATPWDTMREAAMWYEVLPARSM